MVSNNRILIGCLALGHLTVTSRYSASQSACWTRLFLLLLPLTRVRVEPTYHHSSSPNRLARSVKGLCLVYTTLLRPSPKARSYASNGMGALQRS
ncbi:hypothetical protein C8Q76DRAFT_748003 [Earliella scabrosa]|nr:hypothetical protein C8Q76DRAFT_748003 [Earliella scabrosa]